MGFKDGSQVLKIGKLRGFVAVKFGVALNTGEKQAETWSAEL